jgi:hypothetical protein
MRGVSALRDSFRIPGRSQKKGRPQCSVQLHGGGVFTHRPQKTSLSSAAVAGNTQPSIASAHAAAGILIKIVENPFSPRGLVNSAGMGPVFNSDQCFNCRVQPQIGGSSPKANPAQLIAHRLGGTNVLPSFEDPNGAFRETRFKFNDDGSRDGGVHSLFTVQGRSDAPDCKLKQPDYPSELSRRWKPTMAARLSPSTVEATYQRAFQTIARSTRVVSADALTMTITTTIIGEPKNTVNVGIYKKADSLGQPLAGNIE